MFAPRYLLLLQIICVIIAPQTTLSFGINLMQVAYDDPSQILCIMALLRKYFNSGESLSGSVLSMSITSASAHIQSSLLYAIHDDATLPWSIVVKNARAEIPLLSTDHVLHEKPQCYFVIVENLEDEDLEDIFVDLKTTVNWNPLAQFVVYLMSVEETDEEMTELMIEILLSFMNKKIYNVNVIGQNEENGFFYGKTVFPYHPDNNCGNRVITIETLDICDFMGAERDEDDDEEEDDNDENDDEAIENDGNGDEDDENNEDSTEEKVKNGAKGTNVQDNEADVDEERPNEDSKEENNVSDEATRKSSGEADTNDSRDGSKNHESVEKEENIEELSEEKGENGSKGTNEQDNADDVDEKRPNEESAEENNVSDKTTSKHSCESDTNETRDGNGNHESLETEENADFDKDISEKEPTTVEFIENTNEEIDKNIEYISSEAIEEVQTKETKINFSKRESIEKIDDPKIKRRKEEVTNNLNKKIIKQKDAKDLVIQKILLQKQQTQKKILRSLRKRRQTMPEAKITNEDGTMYMEELYRALFLDKFPKDLSGCPLIAAYRPWEPYIFLEKNDVEEHSEYEDITAKAIEKDSGEYDMDNEMEDTIPEIKLTGIEYKMVQTIAERLHISIEIQVENNNLYHLFQQLIDGDIEMIVGGIDEDPSISQYVSSTVPYHQDDLTWCVARAKRKYGLFNFLATFSMGTWTLVLTFVLVTSLAIVLIQRTLHVQLGRLRGYFSITIRVFGMILNQSLQLSFIPTPLKICLGTTFFMGLLFSNVYQSFLASILTTPMSSYQISHLAEIYLHGMSIMGSVENVRHLNKDGEIFKYIREKFEMCYNIEECLKRASRDDRIAVAVSRQHSFYNPRIPRDHLYCFDRDENLYVYLVTMLLPKKFHLLHKINPIIQHVIESGHMQKWARDLEMRRKLHEETAHVREESVQSLTLEQIMGSFAFAGIMLLFAGIVFALECWVHWWVRRRTRCKLWKLLHRQFL